MQRVAVVPERHPAVGRHVVHVDVLVKHHHQLALGVNHHQNLLLVHRLDHLAHIAAQGVRIRGNGELDSRNAQV